MSGAKVARGLLLALVVCFVAPALELAGDDGGRCCRGRCCCAGAPSERSCLRTACPCGDHTRPSVAAPSPEDGLLPFGPVSEPADPAVGVLAPPTPGAVSAALAAPEHPPRPLSRLARQVALV